MSLKQRILNSLIDQTVESSIVNERTSPSLAKVYSTESIFLNNIFTSSSIPVISYKSNLTSEIYNRNFSKLISMISGISNSSTLMYEEHRKIVNQFNLLYRRTKERSSYFKDLINEVLGYSCKKIDIGYNNQTTGSYVGKIGKYITLPFFMNSVLLYNGPIRLNTTSSGNITFSNFESINSLPFISNPSLKITNSSQDISLKINIVFNKTTMNALYFKLENKTNSVSIDFNNNGAPQYKETFKTNEIFTSFNQIECDSIIITIALKNTNTDKPLSVQIDDMQIFEDIQFSKSGVFESKNKDLSNSQNPSSLSLLFDSSGEQNNIWPMLSISTDIDQVSYNSIIKDESIDISTYKFKYDYRFDTFISKTLSEKVFDVIEIENTDPQWNMDYKNALILYGVNSEYMSLDSLTLNNSRLSNWTQVGNYYKTMILNYQDDVSVNIGNLNCIINGREYTGVIKIPKGFSSIEVHSKDMNFEFGDMLSKQDTSNLYNFAYLFGGIPQYENEVPVIKTKEYNIANSNTIELGNSFIPFTESVTDGYGNLYSLVLSKTPNQSGTYTIEPFSGKIKVNPINQVKTITVTYIPTEVNRRSVGILFNRLLTFTNIEELTSSQNTEDLAFSFNGSSDDSIDPKRFIILPNTQVTVKDSHILCNIENDKLYTSTKIKLSTDNKYKTPTVSDIFLAVK